MALLFKETRQCLIIQGTAVVLIIQQNDGNALIIQGIIAALLFKESLWCSRNCYVVDKGQDHSSVLVIQGITVVFQLFNSGILMIQATTVSLLITTNYNT